MGFLATTGIVDWLNSRANTEIASGAGSGVFHLFRSNVDLE
jgi:hypothetical protein